MGRDSTGSDRRLLSGVLTACAALGGLAGAAAGQSGGKQERVVVVAPPGTPAPPGARSGGGRGWVAEGQPEKFYMLQIHKNEQGRDITMILQGDQLTVTVDGRTVPEERVKRSGKTVTVYNEDGSELATFDLKTGTDVNFYGDDGNFEYVVNIEGATPRMFEQGEPPRVMVGITMVDVTDMLREHLGIEEGQATMIDRVIEGLPADRAGLRRGDIIVSIEGKKPATPQKLREILRDKEPGQQIELRIVQKGKEKTVRLELDKYDAEELQISTPMTWAGVIAGDDIRRQVEGQLKELELERRALQQHGQGGQRQAEALRMREQALRRMLERGGKGEGAAPTPPEPPLIFTPRDGGGWGATRSAPADARQRMAELDERLAGLDERLNDLDAKLSRIEKALSRLADE